MHGHAEITNLHNTEVWGASPYARPTPHAARAALAIDTGAVRFAALANRPAIRVASRPLSPRTGYPIAREDRHNIPATGDTATGQHAHR